MSNDLVKPIHGVYGLTHTDAGDPIRQPAAIGLIQVGGSTRGTTADGKPCKKPYRTDGYFRITRRAGHGADEVTDYVLDEATHRLYGEFPNELDILWPFDTLEEGVQTWMEEETKAGLYRRCNGQQCVTYLAREGGEVIRLDMPKIGPCDLHSRAKCGCKRVLRMFVTLLPPIDIPYDGVADLCEIGVVHKFRTSGRASIIAIHSALLEIQDTLMKAGLTSMKGLRLKMWTARVRVRYLEGKNVRTAYQPLVGVKFSGAREKHRLLTAPIYVDAVKRLVASTRYVQQALANGPGYVDYTEAMEESEVKTDAPPAGDRERAIEPIVTTTAPASEPKACPVCKRNYAEVRDEDGSVAYVPDCHCDLMTPQTRLL